MQCPFCNAALTSGAKFCRACGESLTKICQHCDKLNSIAARFCGGCGHAFSNSTVNGASPEDAAIVSLAPTNPPEYPSPHTPATPTSDPSHGAEPDAALPVVQEIVPTARVIAVLSSAVIASRTPPPLAADPTRSMAPAPQPTADPDTGSTPALRIRAPGSPAAGQAGMPKWIILAAVVAVLAVTAGTTAWWWVGRDNGSVIQPSSVHNLVQREAQSTATVDQDALARKVVTAWLETLKQGDFSTHTQFVGFPYLDYWGDGSNDLIVEGPEQYKQRPMVQDLLGDPVLRKTVYQFQQSYPPQAIDQTIAGRVDPGLVRRFIGKDGKLIRVGFRNTQNDEQRIALFAVRITEAGAKVVGMWEHSNVPIELTAETTYPTGEEPTPPPQNPGNDTIQEAPHNQAPMQREMRAPPPTPAATPVARAPERPKGIRELLIGRWRMAGGIMEYRPDGLTQGYRERMAVCLIPVGGGWRVTG